MQTFLKTLTLQIKGNDLILSSGELKQMLKVLLIRQLDYLMPI